MDEGRRGLERQAATDDPEAQTRLKIARCRSGEHCYHDTPLGDRPIELVADEVEIQYGNEGSTGSIFLVTHGDESQVRFVLGEILRILGMHPLPPEDKMKLDCSRCGAKVDAWCVTKSGNRAKTLHVARGSADGYTDVNILDHRYDETEEEEPIYGEEVYAAAGLPYPPPTRPRRRLPDGVRVNSSPLPPMPFLGDPLAPPENIHMRMQPGQTVTIQQPDGSELTLEF